MVERNDELEQKPRFESLRSFATRIELISDLYRIDVQCTLVHIL